VRRHVLHDVDLAGHESGEPGAEFGDEAEGHLLMIAVPFQ
jgi:hypothetical protein